MLEYQNRSVKCLQSSSLLPRRAAKDGCLFNAIRAHQNDGLRRKQGAKPEFSGRNVWTKIDVISIFGIDAIWMVAMKCDFSFHSSLRSRTATLWNRLAEGLRSTSAHSILRRFPSSPGMQDW